MDKRTLEKKIVSRVQSEVDSVNTTVKTRVQDAVLTGREHLVFPREEWAMKSANASSGQSVDGNVLEPEQRVFSGNVEGLQMTTPSRKTSHLTY